MHTVTIDRPGLYPATIAITAESTVVVADDAASLDPFDASAQVRTGLWVDGRFYPLVLTKFLDGRPDLAAMIEAVRQQVASAVAELAREVEDAALIALAGGPLANPYQLIEIHNELRIVDTRGYRYVATCSRFDSEAHTMSARPRQLWLEELRAQAEALIATAPEPTPAPDDEPTPESDDEPRQLYACQKCGEACDDGDKDQYGRHAYCGGELDPIGDTDDEPTPCLNCDCELAIARAEPTPTPDDEYCGCVRCAEPASMQVTAANGYDELMVCRACFAAHYAPDEPTPAQQTQRDAENEADMADFLATTGLPAHNPYQERLAARRERLERQAAAAQDEAARRLTTARAIGSHIPMGQPILVGHHSEGRHRRDIERINTNMRKGIEAQQQAEALRGRAAGVGHGGISSDDPEALEQLQAKLGAAKERHALMVATNKAWRLKDAGKRQAALEALGHGAALVASFLASNEPPYASYQLTNSSGRIKATEQRIAQVQRDAAAQTEVAPISFAATEAHPAGQLLVEDNRVILTFESRTSKDFYSTLRGRGFVWARSRSGFVRKYSADALYWARQLVGLGA